MSLDGLTLDAAKDLLGGGFLVLGAFFLFSSALGMMRMRDLFTRLHPAGVGDTVGLCCILIGLMLHVDAGWVTGKILLLAIFSLTTSATACHALAKAAMAGKHKPSVRKE